MESVFSCLKEEIQSHQRIRDRLGDVTKSIQDTIVTTQTDMLRLHRVAARSAESHEIILEIYSELNGLEHAWKDIRAVCGTELERFRHSFRSQVQTIVLTSSFAFWIEERGLITKEQVEKLACFDPIGLDVEDYLIGISGLSKELSRFCVNSVTFSDFSTCIQIQDFVSQLFAAFQQLNLRNDMLRRKYDGIKYDLQKIEGVIYDLKVRKLIP